MMMTVVVVVMATVVVTHSPVEADAETANDTNLSVHGYWTTRVAQFRSATRDEIAVSHMAAANSVNENALVPAVLNVVRAAAAVAAAWTRPIRYCFHLVAATATIVVVVAAAVQIRLIIRR